MESPQESSLVVVQRLWKFFDNRRQAIRTIASIVVADKTGIALIEEEGFKIDSPKIFDRLELNVCHELTGDNKDELTRLQGLCLERQGWVARLNRGRELKAEGMLQGLTTEEGETVLKYLNTQLSRVDQKVSQTIEENRSNPKFFLQKLT